MKRFLVALFVLLSLQIVSTFAQTPQPDATPDKDPVVITTNLIQIDVTVHDKDGNVVRDLKPEDFEVYEDGKPQQITNFSFVTLAQQKAAEAVAARKNPKNQPVGPTIFRPEQVRRTIAIVVDDLGLSFPSAKWTKDAVKKFVDEQMQPGDLVAIIRTGSGIGALQQFTSDKRLLYAAIDKIRWNSLGRGGVSSFSPIEPTLAEILSGVKDLTDPIEGPKINNVAGTKEQREFLRDFTEGRESIFSVGTLGAVNYVIRGMDQLPGRKAVLLFSDGFKLFTRKGMDSRIADGIDRLADQANRAGVILYTLDARGLEAPMATAADSSFGIADALVFELLEERRKDLLDTQQSMRYLAEQTGGFAITNINNLKKGVAQILNDQQSYYLLGYQPDEGTFASRKIRFNKLDVKVKRPGLKVRHRTGYFNFTDAEIEFKTQSEKLIAAITSPFAAREIEVRLTSLFTQNESKPFMWSLLHINSDDLKFTEEADGWHKAQFEIVVTTFGDNGQPVGELINRKQTIRAKADVLEQARKDGLVASVMVPIAKPGAYQMRVALIDERTRRVGSASQYIEVPDPKKKRLAMSGIFLGRPEVQNIKTSAGDDAAFNIKRDAAVRRFRVGDKMTFDWSVYNSVLDKATNKPNLATQFKIFHEGKEVFASQEKPLDLQASPDGQQLVGSGAVLIGSNMTPGDYVLQVIVKDLRAGSSAVIAQWIDFEVIK